MMEARYPGVRIGPLAGEVLWRDANEVPRKELGDCLALPTLGYTLPSSPRYRLASIRRRRA